MLPNSYLFVPGDRPERFAKAVAAGADMVVLDLEDAVSDEHKDFARTSVGEALSRSGFHACIRLNGADTAWFSDDCELLALHGVAAVMLPKTENANQISLLRSRATRQTAIIPIVETARGLHAVNNVAACAGVQRLAFGSIDLQVDLGIDGDDLELLYARSQLVLASRVAGIAAPVDGVTLSLNDIDQLARDAERARRRGFTAKLCIHPAQVEVVNRVFNPDLKTLKWAQGVLSVASVSSSGAFMYEGKLVDKPVLDRARTILQRARS